jgi:hypothetical protein
MPGIDHFPSLEHTASASWKVDGSTAYFKQFRDEAQDIVAVFNNCTTNKGSLTISNITSPEDPTHSLSVLDPQIDEQVAVLVENSTPSKLTYMFSDKTGIQLETIDVGHATEGYWLALAVDSGHAGGSLTAVPTTSAPKGVTITHKDFVDITVSDIVAAINSVSPQIFRAQLIGQNAKFISSGEAGLGTYTDWVVKTDNNGLPMGIRLIYSTGLTFTTTEGTPTAGNESDGNIIVTMPALTTGETTQEIVTRINSLYPTSVSVKAVILNKPVKVIATGSETLDDEINAGGGEEFVTLDLTQGYARNVSLSGTNIDAILAQTGTLYLEGGETKLDKISTTLVSHGSQTMRVASPMPANSSEAVVILNTKTMISELQYKWGLGDTNEPGYYSAWFEFKVGGRNYRIPERSDDLLVVHVFENSLMHHAN